MPSPRSRQFICIALLLLISPSVSLRNLFAQEALQPIADDPSQTQFQQHVAPFLQKYCLDCHSGDLAEAGVQFELFTDSSQMQTKVDLWEKVNRLVEDHTMPPQDADQPDDDEVANFRAALQREINAYDCSIENHPGRVTLRRLNKADYNNTIRDLTGLELNLADAFPADDVGNGFDNIGDVLAIPPVLLEKYLDAAQTVAEQVMADEQARQKVFPYQAQSDEERRDVARRNLRDFATKAFRRPVSEGEFERLYELMRQARRQDLSSDETLEFVMTAVLANPHFLFRVEQDPTENDEDGIRSLDGYELAARLSYFLWSSMPDAELMQLAETGELTHTDILSQQAKRMLADPKSIALVENFAGQWLQLRDVSSLTPDPTVFPEFDAALQSAMRRETEVFFEKVIQEDRSILEFLTAEYTYVNERLAKHYGITGVHGEDFERVSAPPGRRGMLTHASILMLTSNPTRTSPVKRGKWILENILAEPPPPPPANVPPLDENGETLGSLRERMEQHRANPACAVCHTKMDIVGFGMEHFDAIGGWRDRDGRFEIDASGELPGGRKFNGADGLMDILVEEKKTEFCRCLARKMLTYALGRGIESTDRCTINDIVASLQAQEYRFSALVTAIVTSDPFTKRETRRTP